MAAGGSGMKLRPYRMVVSAAFTLLFIVIAISSSFSSSPPSDPLRARLQIIYHQASDHAAVAATYTAYARRLKLDAVKQLTVFEDLSSSLATLANRLDPNNANNNLEVDADDDASSRHLEKEAKERIKFARQLVAESKDSFDTQMKIHKLRDTIFAVQEQLHRSQKLGAMAGAIAAKSTPKSLHCLAMRLLEHRISHPELRKNKKGAFSADKFPSSYHHYAIFSNNIIAVSVVVNSAVKNARQPSKHVFHVVTDSMYSAAMEVWFALRPPVGGAKVIVRSVNDFKHFLNSSYSPLVRQMKDGERKDLVLLDHLRFYLPEMFPGLHRIVLLEDDVVVQKDLAGLSEVDLDGKVNGAVEMCFGGFRRYNRYLNFSNSVVEERFSPRACAWSYGVNVFDLDAWRREKCTDQFHEYQNLNKDGTLWKPGNVLPAGLATFYTTTKPLEKTWHVMGLGYNPSISSDEIQRAAVIHFNGNMKPWLDVALNQYKHLWTKYIDTEMEFLQLCNFGV